MQGVCSSCSGGLSTCACSPARSAVMNSMLCLGNDCSSVLHDGSISLSGSGIGLKSWLKHRAALSASTCAAQPAPCIWQTCYWGRLGSGGVSNSMQSCCPTGPDPQAEPILIFTHVLSAGCSLFHVDPSQFPSSSSWCKESSQQGKLQGTKAISFQRLCLGVARHLLVFHKTFTER